MDSDSDPAIFVKTPTIPVHYFLRITVPYISKIPTFPSFFKDKKSPISRKIKIFLNIFYC